MWKSLKSPFLILGETVSSCNTGMVGKDQLEFRSVLREFETEERNEHVASALRTHLWTSTDDKELGHHKLMRTKDASQTEKRATAGSTKGKKIGGCQRLDFRWRRVLFL